MNEFGARARNDESTVPGQKIGPAPASGDSSFRSLAETSLQGIIVHRDWWILFANRAAAQTLGYPTAEELVSFVAISDSARTQQMLRESEERFRNLVEGSPQGIGIIDTNYAPLFVNNAYATMFGYRSIAGMQLLDSHLELIAPNDRDRVRAYGEARLRGDSVPAAYEVDGIRMHGSLAAAPAEERP